MLKFRVSWKSGFSWFLTISRLPGSLFHTFWRAAAQSKWSDRRVSSAGRFASACCAEDVSFYQDALLCSLTSTWQEFLYVLGFDLVACMCFQFCMLSAKGNNSEKLTLSQFISKDKPSNNNFTCHHHFWIGFFISCNGSSWQHSRDLLFWIHFGAALHLSDVRPPRRHMSFTY